MPTIIPPRKHISSAFSKGAPTYAHNASVQREILVKLAAKLPPKCPNVLRCYLSLSAADLSFLILLRKFS
jgi:hypothetical protein